MKGLRKILIIAALLIAAAVGWYIWKKNQASNVPAGIAFGNGRIEATEVDVAAKQQGRLTRSSRKKAT
jgi:HlyD family secretion protein